MAGSCARASRFVIVTVGAWFLFIILAIINAGIRNGVYRPTVGDLAAHQISSITLMVIILVVTYVIFRFSNLELVDSKALLMGTIWLSLTIIFEFIAGHYAFGNPWEKPLSDYNLLEDRIWSLVL